MQFKDLSAIFATWVAIAGGVIGGGAAILEYRAQGERQVDQHVLQTLNMYEQFRNSDMLARREGFGAVQDPRSPAFDFWINYFDTVQACIDANLCDAPLARQLFAPYAIGSLDAVQCRIVAVREIEVNYGLPKQQGYGLLTLAQVETPQCNAPPSQPAAAPPSTPARGTQATTTTTTATAPRPTVVRGARESATTPVTTTPPPATAPRGGAVRGDPATTTTTAPRGGG